MEGVTATAQAGVVVHPWLCERWSRVVLPPQVRGIRGAARIVGRCTAHKQPTQGHVLCEHWQHGQEGAGVSHLWTLSSI